MESRQWQEYRSWWAYTIVLGISIDIWGTSVSHPSHNRGWFLNLSIPIKRLILPNSTNGGHAYSTPAKIKMLTNLSNESMPFVSSKLYSKMQEEPQCPPSTYLRQTLLLSWFSTIKMLLREYLRENFLTSKFSLIALMRSSLPARHV